MAAPTFNSSVEPATNWASAASAGTRTTASFSVLAGDVLVCVAASENQTFTEATPVGGSLTWSAVKATTTTNASGTGLNSWTATVDVDKSMTVAITCGGTAGTRFWGFDVYVFRGSAGVGASAVTAQVAGTTNATQALTTTQANSAVLIISADWNAVDGTTRTWATVNSITPTAGNGLERSYFRDVAAYAVYTGYWNDVGAIGAKTFGVSAPTGQRNSIIAIEVKGSAGGAAAASLVWPVRSFTHMMMR
jgi:hypothetical protein